MKLMSPLRSTLPFFTLETSSSRKLRRMSSSTSCVEIWLRRMVSQNKIAILDDYFRQTFNQATEPMRMKGDEREQTMQKHKHKSATEGGKKCGAAVDRAREH